jgi:hypothetical protein
MPPVETYQSVMTTQFHKSVASNRRRAYHELLKDIDPLYNTGDQF